MPKKEEILEKKDKIKKEKISKQPVNLEAPKKSKAEQTSKKQESNSAKKTNKQSSNTKGARNEQTMVKTTKKTTVKGDKEKVEAKKKTKTSSQKTPKKELTNVSKKSEVVEDKKEETKVDEMSVIEKIKNFIAKIAAMQEEAKKEAQTEKDETDQKDSNISKATKKAKIKDEEENKKIEYMLEYYDLPYRYNETVVKILAQTPKRMFVYWDISDNDREKYMKTFGEDFFEKTYPVLLLYNEDRKCIKEIPINDFANSWYIDIPNPKTKYSIQLGRKFKAYNEVIKVNMQKVKENNIILHTYYLPLANSNLLEAPNDHVLLESLPRFITFRNVKTNKERVVELKDIKNIYGNNYDINKFYEDHYKDEISEGMFDMANPSSNPSSSSFK